MNETFHLMRRACIESLDTNSRREVGEDLLNRIIRACADAVTPADHSNPPELQYIRAFTLRVGDLVWRPDQQAFFVPREIKTDSIGLLHVEYHEIGPVWYTTDEVLQVPLHRHLAAEWNERRRDLTTADAIAG
jgi:hypothetical protein